MEFLDALTRVAETIANNWPLIVAALGLSAFQVKINKWFNLQSDRLKVTITGVLSVLGAGIPLALGWLSSNPEFLGAYSAVVFSTMTFAYRFVIKPTTCLIEDAKNYRAGVESQVATPADPNTQVIEPGSASTTEFPL